MDRADLKHHARECMRNASTSPYLVTLAYLAIPVVFGIVMAGRIAGTVANMAFSGYYTDSFYDPFYNVDFLSFGKSMLSIGVLFLIFALLYFLINVGYSGYCLRVSRGQDAGIGNLFDYINRPLRFFGLYLLLALVTAPITLIGSFVGALGSLAASIVSVYISLGFAQATFVAIDNPELGVIDCMRESWHMMSGRRWEYFVLQLSFIGWALLSVFAIPIVFVMPYMQVTMAGYYSIISDWQPEDGDEPYYGG